MKDLKMLFNNLTSGRIYGYHCNGGCVPCFCTVLDYQKENDMFYYSYYGSSAVKGTLDNLKWILETIFRMTAKEFMQEYEEA